LGRRSEVIHNRPHPKRKLVPVVTVIAVLAFGLACRRIEDNDLTGRFVFERDSVRLELRLNPDHTYTETVTQARTQKQASGAWRTGTVQNLSLVDVWVPFVQPGSDHIDLRQTLFSFQVVPCGSKLCLGVSDNDPALPFVKE
jgi:hypothetical protein